MKETNNHCWQCGKSIMLAANKKISFRSLCPFCSAYLHACVNCIHYKLGKPNDCEIAEVELVRDKESFNFCEYFELKGEKPGTKASLKEVEDQLFGNSKLPKSTKNFDDLFKP